MINLLLFNNFYPVMSYRRVQKEKDELLCTVWSLVMVRNQLPAQVVNLLRWKDVPRTNFLSQNCNIFSVLSISKYNLGKTNKFINYQSFLSSNHTDMFKKKATNCCVRFGHSLWSAISCQRKWLIEESMEEN